MAMARMALVALSMVAAIGCGNGGVGRDGDVVGGPCEAGGCAGGSTCLVDTMFPGGTCTVPCESQADCPGGTVCVQEGGGTCLLACDAADDCRDGYACIEKSAMPEGSALVCIRGSRAQAHPRAAPRGYVCADMSSTSESFRRLRDAGFSRRFYDILLASDARIAALFRATDLVRQRELFEHGVQMLLELARGSAVGRLAIERLGRMHGPEGAVAVTSEMYEIWLDAFVRAARECDPRWDAALENDWRRDLAVGLDLMRRSADLGHAAQRSESTWRRNRPTRS